MNEFEGHCEKHDEDYMQPPNGWGCLSCVCEESSARNTDNSRNITPEARAAWFEYNKAYSGAGKPSVTSFIAGWNAAQSNAEFTHEEVDFIATSLNDKICVANRICNTQAQRQWLIGHTSYIESIIEKVVRIRFKK